ncbi:hypothetical protein C8R48DRAFT_709933 [Suillus tomentosus]|jgi:NADH:flavin oxidoreductase / NADH oxidase family|nr:hypothetical protein C8R48DRAFT_709933 [Suillus tomentosus]
MLITDMTKALLMIPMSGSYLHCLISCRRRSSQVQTIVRECIGASFDDAFLVPKELSKTQIEAIAGTDVVETYNAHSYLLFSFLSAMNNTHTDEYGGSFENIR